MREVSAHGERSSEIDYMHVNPLDDPKALPRIKMAVACVPPLRSDSYGPASPIDYSWGIGDKPFLLLMGRKDDLYDPAKADASYHQYIEGPNNKLIWYDRDHKLTEIYVPDALDWVKKHL